MNFPVTTDWNKYTTWSKMGILRNQCWPQKPKKITKPFYIIMWWGGLSVYVCVCVCVCVCVHVRMCLQRLPVVQIHWQYKARMRCIVIVTYNGILHLCRCGFL